MTTENTSSFSAYRALRPTEDPITPFLRFLILLCMLGLSAIGAFAFTPESNVISWTLFTTSSTFFFAVWWPCRTEKSFDKWARNGELF